MQDSIEGKIPLDITDQVIEELNILSDTIKSTENISEKVFEERKFPIKYNHEMQKYEWEENEIREFYEDPENISRTIYCKALNVDETDDWGMFGFTPGFIYIEKKLYDGSRTLADQALLVGVSIGVDPATGLGILGHSDYFPKHKFDYQMIRKTEYPEVFKVMCDIFSKKKIENSQSNNSLSEAS